MATKSVLKKRARSDKKLGDSKMPSKLTEEDSRCRAEIKANKRFMLDCFYEHVAARSDMDLQKLPLKVVLVSILP